MVTYGEGCHNYHHTFPSDYSTPEIGIGGFDVTTALIHFFFKIGWAYNLKKSSQSLVERTMRSKGDENILVQY
jgi:stearoyl-CoA desaturase (delta-9 desaturase)